MYNVERLLNFFDLFKDVHTYIYLATTILNNFMFVSVCLLMTIFQTIDYSLNIKRHDICRPFNKKTVYTAIGSRGIVSAKNDMFNYSKLNVIMLIVNYIYFCSKSFTYCDFRIVFTDNVLCTFFHAHRV